MRNFPILKRKINGQRLVYLDNASTTQKPEIVLGAMDNFYRNHNANIHRGIHTLSQEATELYEGTRDKVQKFINAKNREEIIFTSGATEAINLVVWTWGHENIHAGDEILLSEAEHHSNLVPWQILAKKKRAKLKFIPVISPPPLSSPLKPTPKPSTLLGDPGKGEEPPSLEGRGKGRVGTLDLSKLDKLITSRTKIVSTAHASNVLGTVNPIEEIIRAAHKVGAMVLIDGAQAGGHIPINVQKLNCDFYVLSGHKMYGPTGVGVLYGKKELLSLMPPYQAGGHMIRKVELESSTWADLPHRFEAGTANIAEAIGLGAAIDFLTLIHNSPNPSYLKRGTNTRTLPLKLRGRWRGLLKYESELTAYALKQMQKIRGIEIYGPQNNKDRIGVISFNLKKIPPHDLASILDSRGIAIRTGHHCAMPLHDKLGIESSARISLGIYNTKKNIDAFINGLKYAQRILSPPREGEIKRGSRSKNT
ncbi:MAG: hypothetical protein A2751_01635 [Candidatus Doudnabacteria bacterium RIFCSPHIGHO2_01_FULL_46_14]|uniref:cysteine desulfurase n=1 Tax=Candidatus Doudnabacteria bacterium RIFCSPHIGHO2_01_FULL_46_14 TaxID=1817824 RepID=A0A1F5NJ57_9BACT|nr:MAG: hypothetical protein A2751_01635 [Candidatus Doudnabacteria bacterium RIFCSPHIGHO2_01_FULL_46_14]